MREGDDAPIFISHDYIMRVAENNEKVPPNTIRFIAEKLEFTDGNLRLESSLKEFIQQYDQIEFCWNGQIVTYRKMVVPK